MSTKFVVIDLETTGNSPKKGDKIIQFAAVVVENGKMIEQFSSLVNPGQSIPVFIEELTGINDEMVKDAPVFSEIAPKILDLLDDAYFVAHNVLFDLSFLQDELIYAGFEGFYGPVIDTVELSRFLFPTADSYKLNDLAVKEGLEHDRPHQADSDADVTAQLLIILLQRLYELPITTLKQLLKLSGGLKSDVSLLIDELLLEKNSQIETYCEHLEIYRGIALKKRKDDPKKKQSIKLKFPVDHDEKERLLSKVFSGYEKRNGQFQMMNTVYDSLSSDKHALIEAGTGIGKSLAYLLPAAFYSLEVNEPVVISTFTTQLQEQLLAKDIPLLQSMLPWEPRAVLLKGRSHYLSLAKFEQSLKEKEDNYDTVLTKMQILIWLTETVSGDCDELNLSSGGYLFWDRVKNDETIFLQHSAWVEYDFYSNAKKAAYNADLIITNHSLLLSDLVSEHSILPSYNHLVIDEAHHFERAAGKFFGLSLDFLSVRSLLNQYGLYEQKQLGYKLERLLQVYLNEEKTKHLHFYEVNHLLTQLMLEMDELFKRIAIMARSNIRSSSSPRISYRVKKNDESKEWKAVQIVAERFSFLLKDLIDVIETKLNILKETNDKLQPFDQATLEEIVLFINKLTDIRDQIRMMIIKNIEDHVLWIDLDTRSAQNTTTLYAHPISISSFLKGDLFNVKKSVIMTSATLSVQNSFHFILQELGLHASEIRLEQIPSPFNYAEQVHLVVPTDLPEINSVSPDEYVTAITEHIISLAEATKGRMLILFTSHDMLRKTYHLVKESGLLDDYVLIAQGITGGSRSRLTRNFQRFEKAILFGTNSFWEGIDIPGEDLSCLVIVRLPFSPPDEPFTEAKCQFIKKNGGNSFNEYSLPEAVLRFKQGFGRLIRTQNDKGFIVVFDRRIVTANYGKAFIESIPKVPIYKENIVETTFHIESWLK